MSTNFLSTVRLILIICLLLISLLPTRGIPQVLGRMEVTVIPEGQAAPIISGSPTRSVLVVRSEISGIQVLSNRGVISTKPQGDGITWVIVEPGTQLFDFRAEGFQSVNAQRIVMPGGTGITVDVRMVTAGSSEKVDIHITSTPSGARIWIDGIRTEMTTPAILEQQLVGTRKLHLEPSDDYLPVDTTVAINKDETDDYLPVDTTVAINKDETKAYHFDLVPSFALVRCTSLPAGAQVIVDNVNSSQRNTPFTLRLDPGRHELLFKKLYYEDQTEQINVDYGDTIEVYIELAKIYQHALSVSTNPPGAQLKLDHQTTATSPYTFRSIPHGNHSLEVSLQGCADTTLNFDLTGQQDELKIDLIKLGTLEIKTDPSSTTLTIDGRRLGRSPQTVNNLRPGSYTIVANKEGYLEETATVRVRGGRTNHQKISLHNFKRSKVEIFLSAGTMTPSLPHPITKDEALEVLENTNPYAEHEIVKAIYGVDGGFRYWFGRRFFLVGRAKIEFGLSPHDNTSKVNADTALVELSTNASRYSIGGGVALWQKYREGVLKKRRNGTKVYVQTGTYLLLEGLLGLRNQVWKWEHVRDGFNRNYDEIIVNDLFAEVTVSLGYTRTKWFSEIFGSYTIGKSRPPSGYEWSFDEGHVGIRIGLKIG